MLCMTVHHHDLTRLQDPVRIGPVKGRQSLILQILCQTVRPGPGSGKQHGTETEALVFRQILHQHRKAGIIGADRPDLQTFPFCDLPLSLLRRQRRDRHAVPGIQRFLELSESGDPVSRQGRFSFFLPPSPALGILFLDFFPFLHQTVRLVQNDQGIVLWKIIQERDHPFFRLFLDGRIQGDLLQIFERTLAFGVKGSDRIDLVPPQLDPDGIVLGQRINVHDPAAHGKFARHGHLAGHLVTRFSQPAAQFHHIQNVPVFQPFKHRTDHR